MWVMSNTFAKYKKVGQEELRRLLNCWLRHQEEPTPWCQTWSFRTATNLQSQSDVTESSPTQSWWVQKPVLGWQNCVGIGCVNGGHALYGRNSQVVNELHVGGEVERVRQEVRGKR